MKEPWKKNGRRNLEKVLGLKDLVLLNIATVIGLSSLTQAAQFGWSSFPLWILAAAFFLIPLGIAVADLSGKMPGEGGFYQWTKNAFGEWHGFVAAWSYWLSNIVWLPTVLLTVVMSAFYIFGNQYLDIRTNTWLIGGICLSLLWLIILLNIFGLRIAKWIQNIGAISLYVLFGLLFIAAVILMLKSGPAQPISLKAFIPDLKDFSVLPFFAAIAFSFGGFELASVMSEEIKEPEKNINKAIWISGIFITLFYLMGTFALLVSIPSGEVNIVDGIAQAFYLIDDSLGWPVIGPSGALLVTLGTIGLFGAWLSGSARLPFVIGLDNYLPPLLGELHPKYKSPHVSLILQGILISALFIISIAGSQIKEAYSVLYDMSVVLYFIPFLYLFASFLWHNRKKEYSSKSQKSIKISKTRVWICACLGFSVIFLSIIMAFMPSGAIVDRTTFYFKIIGGTLLLNGIGLLFYYRKRN